MAIRHNRRYCNIATIVYNFAVLTVGFLIILDLSNVSGARFCYKYDYGKCNVNFSSTAAINQSIYGCLTTVHCNDSVSREHCIAVFRRNSSFPHGIELSFLDCWANADFTCSEDKNCPLIYHNSSRTYRCCCKDDYCNKHYLLDLNNVTYETTTASATPSAAVNLSSGYSTTDSPIPSSQIALAVIIPIAVIVLATIALTYWMCRRNAIRQENGGTNVIPMNNLRPENNDKTYDVELIERIGYGACGSVWKGKLNSTSHNWHNNHNDIHANNSLVAVKILTQQKKMSWEAEKEMYHYLASHSQILHFYFAEKRHEDEYWIVTEFHCQGSLHGFLKDNALDWNAAIKMARSIAEGLAYLHWEGIGTDGELSKPSIAHRDFKSKNVLVKSDGTCCIADFGLAVKFDANTRPIDIHAQVGTYRYMSPEVLDGAISFNRESFLRIDVYALALVLWEIMSRCSINDSPPGAYHLPFEEELGRVPTLEQMQTFVVDKKSRPKMENNFLSFPSADLIRETIEDCWDDDAEARLTAGCVAERLASLCDQPIQEEEHFENLNPIEVELPPKSEESTV